MQTFDLNQLRRLPWLNGVELHGQLASTNLRASELAARNDAACPLLIVAESQSAGKGRGSNRWWSSAGALTFSLLVEAVEFGLSTEQWPRTSLCAALAVRDTLAELSPDLECAIKWPNDVFLAARKISGVLVEAPPRKIELPHRLVIGIGVNVNNTLADAPTDVRTSATSLIDQTGRARDLTEVLAAILTRLIENLYQLAASDPSLPERWQQYSLLDGRTVTVDLGARQVSGYCLGINTHGALDLATEFGVEAIHAGVVSSVSPDFRAL